MTQERGSQVYRIVSAQRIAFQQYPGMRDDWRGHFNQLIFGRAPRVEILRQVCVIGQGQPGLAVAAIERAVQ